jgi:hypothetical protein
VREGEKERGSEVVRLRRRMREKAREKENQRERVKERVKERGRGRSIDSKTQRTWKEGESEQGNKGRKGTRERGRGREEEQRLEDSGDRHLDLIFKDISLHAGDEIPDHGPSLEVVGQPLCGVFDVAPLLICITVQQRNLKETRDDLRGGCRQQTREGMVLGWRHRSLTWMALLCGT